MTWEFKFVISRLVIVLVAFIFMHLLVALTSYERIFGTSRPRVKPAKAKRSSARKLAKSLVPVNPAYTAPAPAPFKAQFISIIPYELRIAFRGSEKLMLLVLPLLAAQYFQLACDRITAGLPNTSVYSVKQRISQARGQYLRHCSL
ncbi:hypothetical protein NST99_25415 [Paenibacillus sp. FSL L8-0470]|uniref:hypothetical protein n=1 Tax=Paenibacillus sp. FSL L8-0470 TaxID=2954688 RepID=UPI0030F6C827